MKRFFIALTAAVCALCTAFGFTACNPSDGKEQEGKWGSEYTVQAAFAKAQELGYGGSLEEFIASISGKDGADGKNGSDGKDGTDGINGKDGVGIEDIAFNSDGELVITFTDETSKNLGKIKSVCEHDWSEWETLKEATCTSNGYKTRSCGLCGDTDYGFIDECGHSWNKGWVYDDFTVKTCTVCNSPLFIPATQYEIISPVKSRTVKEDEKGLYFVCEAGDTVVSVLDGTVTAVGFNDDGGFVEVEHDGGFKTVYSRVVAVSSIKTGDKVDRGASIGIVSAVSGNEPSQKPRLYFELYLNGNKVDPYDYTDALPVIFGLPVENAVILHGYDEFMKDEIFNRYQQHGALDFSLNLGDKVFAAMSGTVTQVITSRELTEEEIEAGVAENPASSYDIISVTVENEEGYRAVYKFVDVIQTLKVGDKVKKGDLLGSVTEPTLSEKDFGTHLHFELYFNNDSVDPADYLDL